MRIAIWGAGKFGNYVYRQLKDTERIEVMCFIDKNSELEGSSIDSLPIISPNKLEEIQWQGIEYILVAFSNGLTLYEELTSYPNYKYGFVRECVYREKLNLLYPLLKDSNIFWIMDITKPMIKIIETNIVDYCNLNCKGCSHFSNLFQKGDQVTYEAYCSDLEQIAKNVNVNHLNILGGEPLMNERLTEYINYARKVLPYSEIHLVTNGLLIPKQSEEFFRCCLDNNIVIIISEYLPTARMMDEIELKLKKYGVRYAIRDNRGKFGKNLDLRGRADKNIAVNTCRQNKCHFFRKGKIYKCPFEALANHFFEYYDLNIRLDGGTDIYDEELDWARIVNCLECEPVDACQYCGKEVRYEWSVSNKPSMEEWLI